MCAIFYMASFTEQLSSFIHVVIKYQNFILWLDNICVNIVILFVHSTLVIVNNATMDICVGIERKEQEGKGEVLNTDSSVYLVIPV